MAQADADNSTTTPAPEKPQESFYLPTDVSPEEVFQAIGRLRKEARDEIDRLIRFLDKTDDYMFRELEDSVDDNPQGDEGEAEPSLGWTEQEARWGRHAWSGFIDAELDDCDDEPSLASIEDHPNGYRDSGGRNQERWASGNSNDCEGDEHDGSEPDDGDAEDNDDREPSLGSLEQVDQRRWRHGETGDLEQGTTRNFERSTVYAGRSNVTNLDGSPVTRAQLRGGE